MAIANRKKKKRIAHSWISNKWKTAILLNVGINIYITPTIVSRDVFLAVAPVLLSQLAAIFSRSGKYSILLEYPGIRCACRSKLFRDTDANARTWFQYGSEHFSLDAARDAMTDEKTCF